MGRDFSIDRVKAKRIVFAIDQLTRSLEASPCCGSR